MIKRTILFLLSLLLFAALLAACGTDSPQETFSVTLPTLNDNLDAAESGTDKTVPSDIEAQPGETKVLGSEPPRPEGSYYGESLGALPEQLYHNVTGAYSSGLIWKEPSEGASSPTRICAFASEDGETVTGWIAWTEQPDGSVSCEAEGIMPIDPVEDPGALAMLSKEEAEALLGASLGEGYGSSCEWFTRDGKMLTIFPFGVAGLTDLMTEESALYAEKNTVCVISRTESTTTVVNEARWEAFRKTAEAGSPDTVTLRTVSGTRALDRTLSYDGKVYTVSDKNGSEDYACLITESGEPRSAQDKFSSAFYCLLSDDPEMSWDRYFAQKITSKPDSDFPRTCNLFTVYFYE